MIVWLEGHSQAFGQGRELIVFSKLSLMASTGTAEFSDNLGRMTMSHLTSGSDDEGNIS
jgi:hypothetical protein